MATQARRLTVPLSIGTVQLHLKNVRLSDDITIDEIHLDGGDIEVSPATASGNAATVKARETHFQALISEANINALLAAHLPTDGLARHVRLALLSGKARITGRLATAVVHLPFTVEVVPLVENGVRIKLDLQSARSGFAAPAPLLSVLEQLLNNNPSLPFDLTRLPVPVKVDEIRCEPGRLTVSGRARLSWPPVADVVTIAPFTAGEIPPPQSDPAPAVLPAASAVPALPQL
jgi:hypothetical protein